MNRFCSVGKYIFLFLVLLASTPASFAQESRQILIREALVIASAPGYPEALTVNDPIQASIIRNSWSAPQQGEVVQYGDTVRGVWETVKADSQGWFEHPSLNGGYVYVSVESNGPRIVLLEAMGNNMVYVNGVPRSGNPYGYKDLWDSWEPRFDYSMLPIRLEKGMNDLLFQCNRSRLKVKLSSPRSPVQFNVKDQTMPDLIAGEKYDTWGAMVIINATDKPLSNVALKVSGSEGAAGTTALPLIQPFSVRKVGFQLRGTALNEVGKIHFELTLVDENRARPLDTASLDLRVLAPLDARKETFVSTIDGSVQYYAMNPARQPDPNKPAALFLSLHGAGVEAINQATSYNAKTWGHIVAPTNRRPYGYNWEDWGRLDALEALDIISQKLPIDLSRIYLTGHSMGGHGAYHVGALFPDRFAAIGPSAGWISFWSYRVRETFAHPSPMRQMLMRATLQSDTYTLAQNYSQLGVYILHGSDDDNVLPGESRSMAAHLGMFHKDFIYHEQTGAGHWWDISDEPGADCVDWPPMFDFFARHARPEAERLRQVEFATPSPGISARNNWVSIEAQIEQCKLSSVSIRFDPGARRFAGSTKNVQRLALDLSEIKPAGPVVVGLDSQKIGPVQLPDEGNRIWLEKVNGKWSAANRPSPARKGPHRYGTFKDAIKNRVMFVFGTKGTEEENRWSFEKARYDAERFWYQGNGSIEVIADVDFNAVSDPDRNVVLYGNAATNALWKKLLSGSPVQVRRNRVQVGNHEFTGADLSCLFIVPRPGSDIASVGVVAGTGILGMRLNDRLPYFFPGVSFPDCIVSDPGILEKKEEGVRAIGFFGIDWSVDHGEFVWGER